MGMAQTPLITYKYTMGFAINSTPIPDPQSFSGKHSDLDLVGKRDATGELHRKRVATKVPSKYEWDNIDWSMISTLIQAMDAEFFEFTYPDPKIGTLRTMTAYAGDREWDVHYVSDTDSYVGKFSVSIIER